MWHTCCQFSTQCLLRTLFTSFVVLKIMQCHPFQGISPVHFCWTKNFCCKSSSETSPSYTDPKLFVQLSIPFSQIKKEDLPAGDMFIILIILFYFLSVLQASVHLRLAEQTLLTLTGYLDWVKFAVLYTQNCIILQMLCLLLEEDALKIRAADCLLMIVSRKVGIRFWETSCPPTPSLNQHEHKMGGVGGF